MPIQPGETIPPATLTESTPDGPKQSSTEELFGGKTVVLIGVPGAFTPTCSMRHLPGFVERADEFKAKGADVVACLAVNDAFVLDADCVVLDAGAVDCSTPALATSSPSPE